jgi:hypothetical protein
MDTELKVENQRSETQKRINEKRPEFMSWVASHVCDETRSRGGTTTKERGIGLFALSEWERLPARSRGGLIAGRKNVESGHIQRLGLKNVESGFLDNIRTSKTCSMGGEKTVKQKLGIHDPAYFEARREGEGRGRHTRWHTKRGKLRPDICEFCREESETTETGS